MFGQRSSASAVGAPEPAAELDLNSDLNFLLARATALSVAASNAALATHGLKVRSYAILVVAASGERPSQRDLASFLHLDPSQVVALVDDLEQRGLVERLPDPRDRRANVVVATELGLATVGRALADVRGVDAQTYAGLTAAEAEQLTELLRRVAFPD